MSYKSLSEALNSVHTELKNAERAYAIGDRLVFTVIPHYTSRNRRVGGEILEVAHLGIETSVETMKEGEYMSLDDSDITSAELMKIVELKGMLEQWKRGDLAELPASTFLFPPPEIVETRGRRRRRIRVDE